MNSLVYRVNKSSNTVKKAAVVLCAVMALLAASLPLFSQAAVGTILGGVFDSSGGAIAGAQVTIIDVARGTTRTLTTDAAGEYTAPSLLSGTYTVRAAAKGFQTIEHTNVLLEVASDVRVDLTLSPGEQTQTVTVTRGSPGDRYHQRHPRRNRHQSGGCLTAHGDTQLPAIAPIASRRGGRAGRQWHGHDHQWPARGS